MSKDTKIQPRQWDVDRLYRYHMNINKVQDIQEVVKSHQDLKIKPA